MAHVLGRLSPGGGVQVVVRGLIQHLDPERVESHVITTRPWTERDLLDEVPAQIHPLGYERAGFRVRDRVWLCTAVARRLMKIRPDVVQLHSGIAWMGVLARLVMPRTSFVLEAHDAPGSGRHRRRNDQFEGWCVRRLGMTAVKGTFWGSVPSYAVTACSLRCPETLDHHCCSVTVAAARAKSAMNASAALA